METITSQNTLQDVARAYAIQPEWQDIWGNIHYVDDEMNRALLSAMGISTNSQSEIDQAMANFHRGTVARWIEPVLVLPESAGVAHIPVNLPESLCDRPFEWQLHAESGDIRGGRWTGQELQHLNDVELPGQSEKIVRFQFTLEGLPPQGYHRFILKDTKTDKSVDMLLVVTPERCFMPDFMQNDNARVWGPAVQLYAATSNHSWGVGDYGDLNQIVSWCGDKGAALVGLNPLHSLFPHNPAHSSPYSPSSRMFFNALLLNIEAIEDFQEAPELRERVSAPEFQALLNNLRTETMIPYTEAGRVKFDVLERLFESFQANHLKKKTKRAQEFQAYVQERGELLQSFALFHALQEHFFRHDPTVWGWPVWPEEYRDPKSAKVNAFFKKHGDRVAYYQYLQWQVECQLARTSALCAEKNLGIGLYMDMAVGVDRGGADVWANQHLFAQSSAVGAPPDEYNQKGQDWGLPPLIPERMREEQYKSFIQILRQNMRHAGALRLDHVMGLMRLFWIPPGLSPAQGAYIHYAVDELFGIMALESQRNRCLVIGEDMGTVPEIVRDRMQRWGVSSYKVFYFEKESEDRFKAPEDYLDTAAVAISTHDLPTLTGFWQSRDIAVRTELDLYPNDELRERQIRDRALERIGMLNLLAHQELLPAGMLQDPATVPQMTPELTLAVHRFVARTRSKVFMVQFEDMLNQPEQINLPGTTEPVYPCWRRRLTLPLESLLTDSRVDSIANAITEERPHPLR